MKLYKSGYASKLCRITWSGIPWITWISSTTICKHYNSDFICQDNFIQTYKLKMNFKLPLPNFVSLCLLIMKWSDYKSVKNIDCLEGWVNSRMSKFIEPDSLLLFFFIISIWTLISFLLQKKTWQFRLSVPRETCYIAHFRYKIFVFIFFNREKIFPKKRKGKNK